MSKPNPLALYQSVEYLKAENAELKALLKIAADALEAANENSRGFMQESGPDTFTMPIIDEALAKIRGAGGVK